MKVLSYNPEPLTKNKAALVLADHHVGLMTGIRDYSIAELKHNVVGLAKAARVQDMDWALLVGQVRSSCS